MVGFCHCKYNIDVGSAHFNQDRSIILVKRVQRGPLNQTQVTFGTKLSEENDKSSQNPIRASVALCVALWSLSFNKNMLLVVHNNLMKNNTF